MQLRHSLLGFAAAVFVLCPVLKPQAAVPASGPTWLNVRDFGAVGDSVTDNTDLVQDLVDRLSRSGGGTLYFPAGIYLQGGVRLRNNVTIWLDRGAEIRGNPDRLTRGEPAFRDSHGKPFGHAIFVADSATNVSLRGEGVIDGRGFRSVYPPKGPRPRPFLLLFRNCRNVLVEGLTLRNSAAWVQDYIRCTDVRIRGVTVRSYANANNDGLDIDGSQRVLITGCNISSGDDAIVLKSLSDKPCKDVVISDCVISGWKSAIKFGTESLGGFENVAITNCAIYGTRGIDLFSVDGGDLRNVTISNIAIRDAYGVLSIRLGARMRPYSVPENQRPHEPGHISDVLISNIQAENITESNDFISGIPNHPVERITLRDIRISYKGGGRAQEVKREIPEKETSYPKKRMFGTLPCYGLFVRHARDLRILGLDVRFENVDARPAVFVDDVQQLEVAGLRAAATDSTPACIWMKDVRAARLINCTVLGKPKTFLHVEGGRSKAIQLLNCSVGGAGQAVSLSPEVAPGAVGIR